MSSDGETGTLVLDLRQHGICWVLPEGATICGASVDLPGGALILGSFTGSIVCREGSLIIARQGEFSGQGHADRVYIEGSVPPNPSGRHSVLQGRQLIAVSELAKGQADLLSSAFAIHTTTFAARFTTVPADAT